MNDWQKFSIRPAFDPSIDWSTYRFRASSLHRLCAGGSELTEGNKKYLEILYYQGDPRFSSPALEKGTFCEDLAFKKYGLKKYKKFPHELGNQYIKGTPDIVLKTKIVDIKCPFTVDSFENYDQTKARHYYWQLQAYMILTGLRQADILACWIDTPTEILEKWQIDFSDFYLHSSEVLKTKRFHFKYSREAEKLIYHKIKLARNYLINLHVTSTPLH